MFKKFVNKIRFWLIRKLGGYPHPNVVRRFDIGMHDLVELHSTMSYPKSEDLPIFEVERVLVEQIADEILKNKLFHLHVSYNSHTDFISFKMDALVVKHRDEAWC